MNMSKLHAYFTVLLVIIMSIYIIKQQNKILELENTPPKVIEKTVEVKSELKSFVDITEEDLIKDMITKYPHLSEQVKKDTINQILETSETYNINPLILYFLIHTESSFRFWIEHDQRTVKIDGKKVKVKAVGYGGVVWEWYKTELIEANIANVRSDLFNPIINIKAIGYIYNELRARPMHKKATNADQSAMIRYFGGGYESYFNKIDSKISEIISSKIYR